MISVLPNKGHTFLKLLLIAGAIYAYQNRSGISAFLAKNETFQELKSSLKWAYNELRPATEAEKKQREEFGERQRQTTKEYHQMGVRPHLEFATPDDGKKWEEAKKDWPEMRKQLYKGIDD